VKGGGGGGGGRVLRRGRRRGREREVFIDNQEAPEGR
jgi:hypothetical protein